MNTLNTLVWVSLCILFYRNSFVESAKKNPTGGTQPSSGGGGGTDTNSEKKSASTDKKQIELDVESPSLDGYGYKREGYCLIFTPRDSNTFVLVKVGSARIWKASSDTEHSKKVVYDSAKKIVTVHIGDKTEEIKRDEKNKWPRIDGKNEGCCGSCEFSWCCLFTCGIYNCCKKN